MNQAGQKIEIIKPKRFGRLWEAFLQNPPRVQIQDAVKAKGVQQKTKAGPKPLAGKSTRTSKIESTLITLACRCVRILRLLSPFVNIGITTASARASKVCTKTTYIPTEGE